MTNRYRLGLGRRRISPAESDCNPKAEPESRPTRAMRRVNAGPAVLFIRPRDRRPAAAAATSGLVAYSFPDFHSRTAAFVYTVSGLAFLASPF